MKNARDNQSGIVGIIGIVEPDGARFLLCSLALTAVHRSSQMPFGAVNSREQGFKLLL